MTTLRDIAKLAGVSTCTVSKILSGGRDHDRYSEACRERVRSAANRLGFTPNRVAHALRTGATGIIAFAIDWAPIGTGNAFQSAMIAACEAAARRRGLHLLMVGPRGGTSAITSALDLLEQRQCDGVIIPGNEALEAQRDVLTRFRSQIAFLGQVPAGFCGGELDDAAGVEAAVDHLHAQGHHRLAWIEATGCDRAHLRRDAFTQACLRNGLRGGEIHLPGYPTDSDDEAHVAHVRAALLARQADFADCSALVCYHDLTAIGAYAALATLGRRVPHDIAVVGFDNVHAATAIPALTSIDHELPALAEAALDALRNDAGSSTMVPRRVAPRLITRASTSFTV